MGAPPRAPPGGPIKTPNFFIPEPRARPGPPRGGERFVFDKLKRCGGESLRRLFRLDFCIFELFIKSIFEESAIFHFFAHFGPPGPGGHHGDLGPKETSRGNLVFLMFMSDFMVW